MSRYVNQKDVEAARRAVKAELGLEFDATTDSLGHGTYANVFRARRTPLAGRVASKDDEELPTEVAVKVGTLDPFKRDPGCVLGLTRDKVEELTQIIAERQRREAAIHKQLRHPHIVRLFHFLITGKHHDVIVLVMELCTTSLGRLFNRQTRFAEEDVRKYARQLSSAFEYLGSLGIAHRDISPGNILCVENPAASEADVPYILKVVDFGFAKALENSALFTTMDIGTPLFRSPEQTLHKAYTMESDIWAIGTILYFMATGRNVIEGVSTFKDLRAWCKSYQGLRFPANPELSENCRNFLSRCLKREPGERIKHFRLLTHRWLLSSFCVADVRFGASLPRVHLSDVGCRGTVNSSDLRSALETALRMRISLQDIIVPNVPVLRPNETFNLDKNGQLVLVFEAAQLPGLGALGPSPPRHEASESAQKNFRLCFKMLQIGEDLKQQLTKRIKLLCDLPMLGKILEENLGRTEAMAEKMFRDAQEEWERNVAEWKAQHPQLVSNGPLTKLVFDGEEPAFEQTPLSPIQPFAPAYSVQLENALGIGAPVAQFLDLREDWERLTPESLEASKVLVAKIQKTLEELYTNLRSAHGTCCGLWNLDIRARYERRSQLLTIVDANAQILSTQRQFLCKARKVVELAKMCTPPTAAAAAAMPSVAATAEDDRLTRANLEHALAMTQGLLKKARESIISIATDA